MAFPTVPRVADGRVLTSNQLDSVATRTFPDLSGLTKNSGDLLIALVFGYQSSIGSNAAFSGWTGGFTEFFDRQASGTTNVIGGAYKWSTGSETGTIAVTQAATITGDASMILLSIPGVHDTTPPEAGTAATGTGNAAPPAFNPTAWDVEDTLWIAVNANGMTSGTGSWTANNSAPANYTDFVGTNPADTSTIGDVGGAVAFRQLAAASDSPAAFGQDTSNARNTALLVAVRPSAAAPANLPLETAAAVSAATLSLTAETQVPLETAASVSSATLDLTTPSGPPIIPLDPAIAVSSATLGLTAATQVPIETATAQSSATLTLRALTVVPLGTATAVSSATLNLTVPGGPVVIPLTTATATSTATLTLTAPTRVALGTATAASAATLGLTAPTHPPLGTSAATSTATLALRAQTYIPLGSLTAQSSATLNLTIPGGPPIIPLAIAAAISTATLGITARTQVPLQGSTAQSSATLVVSAPGAALIPLSLSAGTSNATVVVTVGGAVPIGLIEGSSSVVQVTGDATIGLLAAEGSTTVQGVVE